MEARGSFKHIGNKEKRQQEYRKYKADKRKDKLAKRVARAKEERGPGGAEKKQVSIGKQGSMWVILVK